MATDLRLDHLEDITPHYVKTFREWRRRFFANIEKVRALGFSEPFIRMWEYYLCYCEGGFAERYIGDVQMLFVKPLCRQLRSEFFGSLIIYEQSPFQGQPKVILMIRNFT